MKNKFFQDKESNVIARYSSVSTPIKVCGIFTETPQISLSSVQSSYNEGSMVSIICTASGTPDSDVQWIRNRNVKSSGKKASSLTFSSINRTDDGQYTCKATNLAGNDEEHVILVVYCK